MSLTEISIQLDIFDKCLRKSLAFFRTSPSTRPPTKVKDWKKTVDRLQWCYPLEQKSASFDFWINDMKPRRTCKAATALSFLRPRNCSRQADWLTIIADLSNFEVRLNTFKLEKSGATLSQSILLLSLMNGDMSLLLPQFSRPSTPQPDKSADEENLKPESPSPLPKSGAKGGDFGWVTIGVQHMRYLEANLFNLVDPLQAEPMPVYTQCPTKDSLCQASCGRLMNM
jgi:hypothetical protein